MRKSLTILLSIELFFAVLSTQFGFVHRHAFDKAFMTWHKDPTAENRLELDRQRHLNELFLWKFAAIEFAVMAGVTLLVGYAYQQFRGRITPHV